MKSIFLVIYTLKSHIYLAYIYRNQEQHLVSVHPVQWAYGQTDEWAQQKGGFPIHLIKTDLRYFVWFIYQLYWIDEKKI